MIGIIGLGNPGPGYQDHRHNIGFQFIDYCLSQMKTPLKHQRNSRIEWWYDNRWLFAKPLSFMNLSGKGTHFICNEMQLSAEDLIIVFDDVSLPVGTMRVRAKGSAGGHNGVQSIIDSLQSNLFSRLRFGIGPKPENLDLADFVLSPFRPTEIETFQALFAKAFDALYVWHNQGISRAMNLLNEKKQPAPLPAMGS